jgi:predicted AAA+ superfamily ATPase
MFPETYGRTLEELAFLFEDRALAEEATMKVEKQMEWSAERRWSRVEDRMSWDMDVIVPNKTDDRRSNDTKGRNGVVREIRKEEDTSGNRHAIRGERGGWWED